MTLGSGIAIAGIWGAVAAIAIFAPVAVAGFGIIAVVVGGVLATGAVAQWNHS